MDIRFLIFAGLAVAVMWFLVFRPEQKRKAEHKTMLDNLKKNDRVVTAGGIHGIVQQVKDDVVTLRVDEKNDLKIRVNRSSVAVVDNAGSNDN